MASVDLLQIAKKHTHTTYRDRAATIEANGVINKALATLLEDLTVQIAEMSQERLPSLREYLAYSESLSSLNKDLMAALAAEKALLRQDLAQVPWYDRWTIYNWLVASSKSKPISHYIGALDEGEAKIGMIDNAVDISRENVAALIGYTEWYLDNMVRLSLFKSITLTDAVANHSQLIRTPAFWSM